MKVGVTGAAGNIGSAVCLALIEKGYEPIALVHQDKKSLDGLQVEIFVGDILNLYSLISFTGKCDAIIHAAGCIRLGYKVSQEVYNINVAGTKNVLEAAKRSDVKKVIHISSIHAYRQKPYDLPLNESRAFVSQQSLFYDQTKRDGHRLALQACKNGQDVVVVAPTSVLGPPDTKPSKLGKAIIDIYRGFVPAAIPGGFDFADVRDVAGAIVAALEKGRTGETYIVGGKYFSIKELTDMVLEVKGTRRRLPVLPFWVARVGLPFIKIYSSVSGKPPLYDGPYLDILKDSNRHIDSQKAKQELGLQVRDLKTTVADMVRWFKEHNML